MIEFEKGWYFRNQDEWMNDWTVMYNPTAHDAYPIAMSCPKCGERMYEDIIKCQKDRLVVKFSEKHDLVTYRFRCKKCKEIKSVDFIRFDPDLSSYKLDIKKEWRKYYGSNSD